LRRSVRVCIDAPGRRRVAGFEQAGGRILVYPNRGRLLRSMLSDALWFVLPVAAVFFLFIYPPIVSEERDFGVFEGIVLTLTAIYSLGPLPRLIYGIYRLVRREPSVTIDEEGFTDRASITGAGKIRWDEVVEAGTFGYGRERYLGVITGPRSEVAERRGLFARAIDAVARRFARRRAPWHVRQAVTWIPERNLSVSVNDLAHRLGVENRRYRKRHRHGEVHPGTAAAAGGYYVGTGSGAVEDGGADVGGGDFGGDFGGGSWGDFGGGWGEGGGGSWDGGGGGGWGGDGGGGGGGDGGGG
jgi:hypothetical protein